MNGRERVCAAFSAEGTPEIAAVIPYEGIYVRDHWSQLTPRPWWAQYAPSVEEQSAWRRDVARAVGQDWFDLPIGASRKDRAASSLQERAGRIYLVDARTGAARQLSPPSVGGWPRGGVASVHPAHPPQTPDEVDAYIGMPAPVDGVLSSGGADLPRRILSSWGASLYPVGYVPAPLWRCYEMWGFEGMMLRVARHPALVQHAVKQYTAHALQQVQLYAQVGALGLWIEDCMTDMVSPQAFRSLNLPYLQRITAEARHHGLHSIYYYCGDPGGKWELLLDTGADALALEESKKGFAIDVEEVVERVGGRMAVLGNLDAIRLLPHVDEEVLRAEIARQIAAGRRNGSRFIMSLGSPVTPQTSAERVRQYCELVHELGR
ncbi:MAG TPA: uroporphyrinogen decarboxylase family protein [Anaerolineae bacterium]|nr:uroporphyrinogen decarboxylase family protein [Anaerolineae bacterium]